jgi:hypothetical protein
MQAGMAGVGGKKQEGQSSFRLGMEAHIGYPGQSQAPKSKATILEHIQVTSVVEFSHLIKGIRKIIHNEECSWDAWGYPQQRLLASSWVIKSQLNAKSGPGMEPFLIGVDDF